MSRVLDFFLAPPDPPTPPASPVTPPGPPALAASAPPGPLPLAASAPSLVPPGSAALVASAWPLASPAPPTPLVSASPAAPPDPLALAASAPPDPPVMAASAWSLASPAPATPLASASPVASASPLAPPGPPALAAPAPPRVAGPGRDPRLVDVPSGVLVPTVPSLPGPPAPLVGAPLGPFVPRVPPSTAAPMRRPRKRSGRGSEAPPLALPAHADFTTVTGAAVLGRTREAEPVAAALALVLRRETRSKAATIAVIGPPLPEASGGGGAGRRIAARLEAHGLEARVRGRLAWVRLDPTSPDLASLAWQVALLAAPVVFAVTAPRTPAIDAALVEQDLVVLVTGDPDGALAAAAAAGLGRVVTARPLSRGLGRELSRAGIRPAAPIRTLLQAGGPR
ncbi:hypothetical protein OJ998_37235 [Solirubrobacter taibaiensis]|nr:hypothetical protein [Solirubrobacter taibaiensis]